MAVIYMHVGNYIFHEESKLACCMSQPFVFVVYFVAVYFVA